MYRPRGRRHPAVAAAARAARARRRRHRRGSSSRRPTTATSSSPRRWRDDGGAVVGPRATAATELRIVERSPDRLVVAVAASRRTRLSMAMPKQEDRPRRRSAYEVSDRVARQASVRPYQRDSRAPLVRPLRIYTLDPSVSDRHGRRGDRARAVREARARPDRLAVPGRSATARRQPLQRRQPLDLDDPHLLLSSGLSPTPANGRFHLQMVYAVCSLTYAAFRRALGRDIAWATDAAGDGPAAAGRCGRSASAARNAGYSREAGDLSFGYFPAGEEPPASRCASGLICTALSHDIVAHETTHALLDGLRSSFHGSDQRRRAGVPRRLLRSGRAVPALHLRRRRRAGASASRAAALTRGIAADRPGARVRLRALEAGRGRRAAIGRRRRRAWRRSIPTCLPRQDGSGRMSYDDAELEPHALGSVLVSAVFEAFTTVVRRKTERLFRIAGLEPRSARPRAAQRRAGEGDRAGGERRRRAVPQHLHPRHRLLPAGRHGARRVPARDHHRRRRSRAERQVGLPRSADAIVPPPRDLSGSRAVHDRGRGALAAAGRRAAASPGWRSAICSSTASRDSRPSVEELMRQAHALGTFVTDPKHAERFHARRARRARCPRASSRRRRRSVQSIRVTPPRRARRPRPVRSGRRGDAVVHRRPQTGELFDMNGGCTVVIDPQGEVRYSIYKRSTARRARRASTPRCAARSRASGRRPAGVSRSARTCCAGYTTRGRARSARPRSEKARGGGAPRRLLKADESSVNY